MAEQGANVLTTGQHVPSEEHAKTFPPFDSQTFGSQLFWLVIVFVALYLLMSKLALPRIGSILEKRRQHMDADLAEADRFRRESDAAVAAYEKALAEARSRAQALAAEMHRKEAAQAEALRKSLDAELNARVAAAEKSIAETRAKAMANVKGIATDAAAAIVERLTGTAPAGADVAAAVAQVLKR
jgi:F-type H+-transporting ATPase subunit b